MVSAPRFPRLLAGALAAFGLLGALACGGKSNKTTPAPTGYTITGSVFYTQIPLSKDSNGVPTGLETDSTKFNAKALARGMIIKLFQRRVATLPDGSTAVNWTLAAQSNGDALGSYRFFVLPGQDYCIQVESGIVLGDAGVNVLADPDGLASALPVATRLRYILRQAPDGTLATPANPTPYSQVNSDLIAQFNVDTDTPWLVGRTDLDPVTHSAPLFDQAVFETTGTGSRITSILDNVYEVNRYLGVPFISGVLDLHYHMGLSDPKGTFIEYDRSRWIQPDGTDLAYDGDANQQHWFGSVQGGAANDDSRDPAVIFPMVARSCLIQQVGANAFAGFGPQRLNPAGAPLDNLVPDMALVEALPIAITANILRSPYLADTNGASLAGLTDIRDLSAVAAADRGPLSARTIAAASWTLILKANSLPDPGVSTDWDKIDPAAMARFFPLYHPDATIDLYNVFDQLKVLQNAQSIREPVNLAKIFTDSTLTTLLQPFGITWPRPTTAPFNLFVTNMGNDPVGVFGPYTLSMSSAVPVNGTYPNLTVGELKYAYFTLDTDTTYDLNIVTSPATLPSGAQVELSLLTPAPNRLTFTVTGSTTQPIRLNLSGYATTPLPQMIRLRLLSPTTQIPDTQVSLVFTKALVPARPR
ncbi:MAG TPA: hypothetical protein VJ600_02120 [Holophagaceae bacterium]|nr:hypothetical protein [Holophagaceae bacterium]